MGWGGRRLRMGRGGSCGGGAKLDTCHSTQLACTNAGGGGEGSFDIKTRLRNVCGGGNACARRHHIFVCSLACWGDPSFCSEGGKWGRGQFSLFSLRFFCCCCFFFFFFFAFGFSPVFIFLFSSSFALNGAGVCIFLLLLLLSFGVCIFFICFFLFGFFVGSPGAALSFLCLFSLFFSPPLPNSGSSSLG